MRMCLVLSIGIFFCVVGGGAEICLFARAALKSNPSDPNGSGHSFIGYRSNPNEPFKKSGFYPGSIIRNDDNELEEAQAKRLEYKQARMCKIVDERAIARLNAFYDQFKKSKVKWRILEYNCANYAVDAWRAAMLTEVPFPTEVQNELGRFKAPSILVNGISNLSRGTKYFLHSGDLVQVSLPSVLDPVEAQLDANRGFQVESGERTKLGRFMQRWTLPALDGWRSGRPSLQ